MGRRKKTINSNKSIQELQHKWKYHRDCYIRARKRLKEYIPSGSSAFSANLKPTYRFFELMRLLDDTLQTTPTISTLRTVRETSVEQKEKKSNFSHCSDVEICSETSSSLHQPKNNGRTNISHNSYKMLY